MEKEYFHIVPQHYILRERLRVYLLGVFPALDTPSSIKKAIAKGQIWIDNRIGYTGDMVMPLMDIRYKCVFEVPESRIVDLDIRYEDDDFMIINKSPGLSSSGAANYSLQLLLKSYPIRNETDSLPYPYLAHRLDRQTSGLIIACKRITSRRILGKMLEEGSVEKTYAAIVEGHLDPTIKVIDQALDGKTAKTEIIDSHLLNTKDKTTIVYVKLHTGRTHQIRRHLSIIGHPIVGDDVYNPNGLSFKKGMFLVSMRLSFIHYKTHMHVDVSLPLSPKFAKYLP